MAPNTPGTFAILGGILTFFRRCRRYRICEWRPSNFALSGILGNRGLPSYVDQVVETEVFNIPRVNAQQPIGMIEDRDVFILVGCCKSWRGICDFRLSAAQRQPRYAAMITPMGISDNTVSELWTSTALMDSTLTGDVIASPWTVYGPGGIRSSHFDLHPNSTDVRPLVQSYRLAGLVCHDDPAGVVHTQIIPGAVGRDAIIHTDGGLTFSRNSHIPYAHSQHVVGDEVWWPTCANEDGSPGRRPSPPGKLVIMGGHVSLNREEMIEVMCGNIAPRIYPVGGGQTCITRCAEPLHE